MIGLKIITILMIISWLISFILWLYCTINRTLRENFAFTYPAIALILLTFAISIMTIVVIAKGG